MFIAKRRPDVEVVKTVDETGLVEVGDRATWTVSSAKPGCGVRCLRDKSRDTFWQSDGNQPHWVAATFAEKITLAAVALQLSVSQDESYTPYRLTIRAGNYSHDLSEEATEEVSDPEGWAVISLAPGGEDEKPLRARAVQIAVLANHDNGRDTRIRQIRMYSPARNVQVFETASAARWEVLR